MNKLSLIFHPFYYNWEKYPVRGIDRYNYELYRNLKKQGLQFEILHSGYVKNHIDGIIKEIIFPLKSIFKKSRLYHATHPLGAKWAIITRKRPLITTIHDLVPIRHQGHLNDWGLKYKVKSWSIVFSAKYSDYIIVPFQSSKNILVNNYNINAEKISIINYGIDHNKYFPENPKRKEKREKIIFFVGELAKAKGVDTLIKATNILIQKNQDIKLALGSNGKDKELLIRMVKEFNIEDRVDFLGRIPENELPNYYRNSDISVFPSRYGFGLATLEAMACGIPAVVGKSLDAIDFINDDRMLTNPDNPEELAVKIENILYNDKLRKELIDYGIKKASEYSWEKMAIETTKIYNRFLNY